MGQSVDSKAKLAKGRAMSSIIQAIEEYKDSDAFEINAAMAATGMFVFEFNNYKKKVIKAYSTLNSCLIMVSGTTEEEEDEEETVEEGEIAKEWTTKGGDANKEVIELPAIS